MTEHPIIFSGPMVRAILAGTKTQTRRVVCNAEGAFWDHPGWRTEVIDGRVAWFDSGGIRSPYAPSPRCPFGVPGESRLWVRETWAVHGTVARSDDPIRPEMRRAYRADYHGEPTGCSWRSSIYMPRWASRITLEVTGVRVERLQDISEKDAAAEGMASIALSDGVAGFREVSLRDVFEVGWDTINGKRAPWASNPWVWVVSFSRVQP